MSRTKITELFSTLLVIVAVVFIVLCISSLKSNAQTNTTATVKPNIVTNVTEVESSGVHYLCTLSAQNVSMASRTSVVAPIQGYIPGYGSFNGSLIFSSVNTKYTGDITVNVDPVWTVSNVVDGGVVTTDDKGTHIKYHVTNIDGQGFFGTTFEIDIGSNPQPIKTTPITVTVS